MFDADYFGPWKSQQRSFRVPEKLLCPTASVKALYSRAVHPPRLSVPSFIHTDLVIVISCEWLEQPRWIFTSHSDDLIRFWRSTVKVTAGCRGGECIHVDAGSLMSILWFCLIVVGGYTTESVMRGWCDARHTVTFPAAKHRHWPLTGTYFLFPPRVGGWVGPRGWLRTVVLYRWMVIRLSTNQAWCRSTLLMLSHAASKKVCVLYLLVGGRFGLMGREFTRDPKSCGFESRPARFQVTAFDKLLTRMCLCHQAV